MRVRDPRHLFGVLRSEARRRPSRLPAPLDPAASSRSTGALAMRRLLGALFIAYAAVLGAKATSSGGLPNPLHLLMAMFGVALIANVAGRFIRDWTLVVAGLVAYVMAGRYAQGLNMSIHYTPQIDAERLVGFGVLPSQWLQEHLYHGRTGVLEVLSVVMYFSHFFVPLALGFYLWIRRVGNAFAELMFALLATSVLANIVFVLYPTAPPWLAAERGGLVHVHHMLKQSLVDLHLNAFASIIGDQGKYNIVAALPSMHAAFPVIALVVAIRYGLPRWLIALQASQLVGVCFAIVYLGDHYVVDALAGAAFALAGVTAANRLLSRSSRTEDGVAVVSRPATVEEPAFAGLASGSIESPALAGDGPA